ncbi:hypothetical protein MYSI104531_17155 [Mycobacterium simiae]
MSGRAVDDAEQSDEEERRSCPAAPSTMQSKAMRRSGAHVL